MRRVCLSGESSDRLGKAIRGGYGRLGGWIGFIKRASVMHQAIAGEVTRRNPVRLPHLTGHHTSNDILASRLGIHAVHPVSAAVNVYLPSSTRLFVSVRHERYKPRLSGG